MGTAGGPCGCCSRATYYGVYRFKLGFGGDIVQYLGCMDLPVRPRLATAWYRLEPLYYRAYHKLEGDVFYWCD